MAHKRYGVEIESQEEGFVRPVPKYRAWAFDVRTDVCRENLEPRVPRASNDPLPLIFGFVSVSNFPAAARSTNNYVWKHEFPLVKAIRLSITAV